MRQRRPRNTATTRFPGNQNALQEDLPEGGTHIHLGDVSCKSLVVDPGGLSPNIWKRLERLSSAWDQAKRGIVREVLALPEPDSGVVTNPARRARTPLTEAEVDTS